MTGFLEVLGEVEGLVRDREVPSEHLARIACEIQAVIPFVIEADVKEQARRLVGRLNAELKRRPTV